MENERRFASTVAWNTNEPPLDQFFATRNSDGANSTWTPNTDVYETEESLVARMELSGINREDLEISLQERLLIVRGLRRDPCRTQKCKFRQMEIEYGYFERRILLPRSVNAHTARAQFNNGFLHITLPKAPHSQHTTVTVILEKE
jgi:HSP20 family protein